MTAARSHDERTLLVLMNGVLLGEIYQERSRGVRLRYDDAYASTPGAVPLSLSMPLTARRHKNAVLAPWLDNLLPDRPEVLTRWRREFRVPDPSAFALLRHVGEDVAGAAQFVHPGRVAEASTASITPVTDVEIADRLRQLRSDPTAWESATGTGQFSLAGSQAKFALHYDGRNWALPAGRTPTTHIIKPSIPGMQDQDLNEHLSMQAAAAAGLTVARSSVRSFDGERAFVVQRYDRVSTGSGWTRVHQEDMCQALGVPPGRKYERNGGPSAADIGRQLRDSVPGEQAQTDLRRFADAIIYNWIVVGTDAHAKNYSLLLASGKQVRLAPLYDLNSYLPYQGSHKPELSMRIGAYKVRPDLVSAEDWRVFARQVGVPEAYIFDRIPELAAKLPDAFNTAAHEPAVLEFASSLPGQLTDAVAVQAERCRAIARRPVAPLAPMARARVHRGIPTGGEFAPKQRPESDGQL